MSQAALPPVCSNRSQRLAVLGFLAADPKPHDSVLGAKGFVCLDAIGGHGTGGPDQLLRIFDICDGAGPLADKTPGLFPKQGGSFLKVPGCGIHVNSTAARTRSSSGAASKRGSPKIAGVW